MYGSPDNHTVRLSFMVKVAVKGCRKAHLSAVRPHGNDVSVCAVQLCFAELLVAFDLLCIGRTLGPSLVAVEPENGIL